MPRRTKRAKTKPSAIPSVGISELLAALGDYESRHRLHDCRYYKLVLYADGSGYILDGYGNKGCDFVNLNQCREILRG